MSLRLVAEITSVPLRFNAKACEPTLKGTENAEAPVGASYVYAVPPELTTTSPASVRRVTTKTLSDMVS